MDLNREHIRVLLFVEQAHLAGALDIPVAALEAELRLDGKLRATIVSELLAEGLLDPPDVPGTVSLSSKGLRLARETRLAKSQESASPHTIQPSQFITELRQAVDNFPEVVQESACPAAEQVRLTQLAAELFRDPISYELFDQAVRKARNGND